MRLLRNSGSEIIRRGELRVSDFDSLTAMDGDRAIDFTGKWSRAIARKLELR